MLCQNVMKYQSQSQRWLNNMSQINGVWYDNMSYI